MLYTVAVLWCVWRTRLIIIVLLYVHTLWGRAARPTREYTNIKFDGIGNGKRRRDGVDILFSTKPSMPTPTSDVSMPATRRIIVYVRRLEIFTHRVEKRRMIMVVIIMK